VAFRPNPGYKPKTYGERTLHAMSGIFLVDHEEKQLAQLSATLIGQVDFGYGAVGRLNRGGTVTITRIRVSPGIWKTSSSRLDINGRIVFFRTIDKQQDELHTDFKSEASDMSLAQGLANSSAANEGFRGSDLWDACNWALRSRETRPGTNNAC